MLLILKYFYCFSAVFYLHTARQAEAKGKEKTAAYKAKVGFDPFWMF